MLDDGRRVVTGCLNQPAYRAFCKEWADAALECGTDYVFWDEPHWTVPEHVGVEAERWACRCNVCRERFGGPMPTELTDEVLAFRERSTVEFLREMCEHVAGRGGRNTICLLPATEGAHGISDWDAVHEAVHEDEAFPPLVAQVNVRLPGGIDFQLLSGPFARPERHREHLARRLDRLPP